jgi:hypothetical protein
MVLGRIGKVGATVDKRAGLQPGCKLFVVDQYLTVDARETK